MRSKGLMIGVAFVLDKQKKIVVHDHAKNILTKAFENGALSLRWAKVSFVCHPHVIPPRCRRESKGPLFAQLADGSPRCPTRYAGTRA